MALSFNLMFKIKHCWKLSQSGTYSSKSAYAAFFEALSSSLLGGGFGESSKHASKTLCLRLSVFVRAERTSDPATLRWSTVM
jgi:hypothetical protein